MNLNLRRSFVAGLLIVAAALPASAQPPVDGGPDPTTVRMRLGPFLLNPTIELTNLGIDTNVFNEATDQNPKRDFTLTFTPRTDVWLRMGRSWLTATVNERVVWYQKYASERSTNNDYLLGWKMPLNRLIVSTSGKYINTRERPGYEIDTRAQREEYLLQGNVEVRGFAKTFVTFGALRQRVNFDQKYFFLDTNLHDELTHTTVGTSLGLRYALTPLTSLSVTANRIEDRFQYSPLRDSDSTAIVGGVTFDPFALVKGTAAFGYRRFRPVVSGLPDYDGATASIDLTYTAFGATRLAVQGVRDIQYSYDVNQPYYLQTGATFFVTQQVYGPFDVVGRYGAQRLAYRDRAGAVLEAPNRVDHVQLYGGGVGYRLGRDIRIGFNVDHQRRESEVENRRYEGMRLGTAVTYGF